MVLIDAVAEEVGTTSGVGSYHEGVEATVVAAPAEGFVFTGWKEGEQPVSSSTAYTFVVHRDVTLTAGFAEVSPPRIEETEAFEKIMDVPVGLQEGSPRCDSVLYARAVLLDGPSYCILDSK